MFTFLLLLVLFFILIAIFFGDEISQTRQKDPAAKSYVEVVLLYPGLHALMAYKFSHFLWTLKIPILPRLVLTFW